jgi:RHS repeat-associated protein
VHGPDTDEPIVAYDGTGATAKSWLYTDHLGSVVATANTAGASTGIYSYSPYGEPNTTAATGPRFRYTGQQLIPELGLYYYKARFYSPVLGRFLQTDPIGTKDDQNLYAYVGNNPMNRTDPSGLLAKEAIALTGRVGSVAMQGINEFMTGGYGRRANEAMAAGDYAAASGYLAAGTLYGAMNVATGLEGEAVKTGISVTDDAIRAALQGSSLQTTQSAISRPAIENYVRRLEAGEIAPAIRVDGNVIVDGNHRYVAGRLVGNEPARTAGTLSSSQISRTRLVRDLKLIQVIGEIVDFNKVSNWK